MNLNENQQWLHEFNVLLRQRLEQAEAKVPRLCEIIESVAAIEILHDTVLLGEVLFERPYGPAAGRPDSGEVIQAALLVPGGLGLVIWDMEDYLLFRSAVDRLNDEARRRFHPFAELTAGERALLLFSIPPLLERLCRLVRRAMGGGAPPR